MERTDPESPCLIVTVEEAQEMARAVLVNLTFDTLRIKPIFAWEIDGAEVIRKEP